MSVDELFASTVEDFLERVVELFTALKHSADESREVSASDLDRHHRFHECKADSVEAVRRDLIGPAQGFVYLGCPALLILANAV